MRKREKKKTPAGLLAVVVTVMLAVYIAQMLFPTSLGKEYGELAENPVEITVTVTAGEKESNISYTTDSPEAIADFSQWAAGKKMKNRSLADSITADPKAQMKFNFAIKDSDGTYSAMVIDGKGYVHIGAELYEISGDTDKAIAELDDLLKNW